jgi:hypothetical protein
VCEPDSGVVSEVHLGELLLLFGVEVSPGTTAPPLPPMSPAPHLPQMESIC